jgi:glycosyltransferase involved in cell wall biosynthesis
MRILLATDAWHPQVNGVVRTLTELRKHAKSSGADLSVLAPDQFLTIPLPTYPGIRLAWPRRRTVARCIATAAPDAIHIATEGPIGYATWSYCRRNGLRFTTSFHTRFPDYLAARLPVPPRWTWAWLRRFHNAGAGTMVATNGLRTELAGRGFRNLMLWPRGVDADLFCPRPGAELGVTRPVFLTVGRLAIEKNLDAFLRLTLPGTKVVVGDGPARVALERQYPDAVFLGARHGTALAETYAAADVFVFPSRTDTFGLVMLEALACGVPVAAFPVSGPSDVIQNAAIGVLDEDLEVACLKALQLSRTACRAFALARSWAESARCFFANISRSAAESRS